MRVVDHQTLEVGPASDLVFTEVETILVRKRVRLHGKLSFVDHKYPGRAFAHLRENVREWLNANLPTTSVHEGSTVLLSFESEKDAALFRLVWS